MCRSTVSINSHLSLLYFRPRLTSELYFRPNYIAYALSVNDQIPPLCRSFRPDYIAGHGQTFGKVATPATFTFSANGPPKCKDPKSQQEENSASLSEGVTLRLPETFKQEFSFKVDMFYS